MSTTINTPTAVAYARSLLELAHEKGQAEAVGSELNDLKKVLDENPSFVTFLSDPSIGRTERAGLMERVFRGQVSPLVMNFLGVVDTHNRLGMLGAIIDAYDELLDELLGKVEVDVTVAQRLDPQQLEVVRQKVSIALGKDAVVHQYVDESIIGGLVLRVQDKMIDSSVRSQLESMREQLLAARK